MKSVFQKGLLACALFFAGPAAFAQDAAAPVVESTAPAAEAPAVAAPTRPAPTRRLSQREQIADLTERLAQSEQALANHRILLAEARQKATLQDELLVLSRERNRQLYDAASEILQRYRDADFGDVLSRREPFVQAKRVDLENLIQDYETRLRASRIFPGTLPPSVERAMQQQDAAAPAAAQ